MRATHIFRALLYCYPASFRQEYGNQMLQAFSQQLNDKRRPATLCARAFFDALTVAPKEHFHVISRDVRYALRLLVASPQFTAVAILSLALGIGATTALFSLWYGVIHSPLPVREPEQLVLLSNPEFSGGWNGLQIGRRNVFTYAEYEQLRDHSTVFAGVMASQSSLNLWPVRVESSDLEEVQARLVSDTYFQVLGVSPVAGRTFASEGGRAPSPYTVLSYNYWQRRFGGELSAIGKTIRIRNAVLRIAAVMPANFFGETVGQQPDLWIPLSMQPEVFPGRDRLHDIGPDKLMWLQVFARLQPGVTLGQAEAQANSVFKAGLEAYYGPLHLPDRRESPLDQRISVIPGATGVSRVRAGFSNPLTVLLIAVGVLLLIACANLANLLFARGAARQPEIALRLSLGASRGRLVRQLITESLVLAVIGGAAGLAAAYALHMAFVRMIAESDTNFKMPFRLDPQVLAFSLGVTVLAALLFGLLPAWQNTRPLTRFARRSAWGRMLVSVQLALSLPLLIGAGLLGRSLYNLQRVDLGFPSERLVLARIESQTAGYTQERLQTLVADLSARLQQIPGVAAVSYSSNSVFSGRASGDDVEVEGYTPIRDEDRYSAYDVVGPRFFSGLGVPILAGREITEGDSANGPRVCVINEAFAQRFFVGRNPLGMRITNVDGNERLACQVVGVVKDARFSRVRGAIQPLYFAPFTQPFSERDGAIFSIRTNGRNASVISAVRETIRRTDPALAIILLRSVEERIGSYLAQDRITARLAAIFGIIALSLAAIGLYGVLSYAIARRTGELAVRIALGALPVRVIGMILRETSVFVIAGLILGIGLAVAATRLIASQLYGLTGNDPLTLAAAIGTLVVVALAAAYLPARRASRLDPVAALKRD